MEFSAERKKKQPKKQTSELLGFFLRVSLFPSFPLPALLSDSLSQSPPPPSLARISQRFSHLWRLTQRFPSPLFLKKIFSPLSHSDPSPAYLIIAPPRHILRSPRYSFKHLRHGSRSHARTHMRELEVVVARFLLLLPLFVLLTYHRVSRLSSAAPFSPQPAAAGSRGAGQVNHTLRRKTHAPPAKRIKSGDPLHRFSETWPELRRGPSENTQRWRGG